MNFYRSVLWWLLLAALGALAWDLLSPDLGEVLVRWHGKTITTTVAFALIAWALLWFFLWAVWALLRLPFVAWKRLAQTQARKRLINGLIALQEGRHTRAEALLVKAAEDIEVRSVALPAAHKAALRRGDRSAAAAHLSALAEHEPAIAAIYSAETLLAEEKPQDALTLLRAQADKQTLPPRGLRLLGEALAACGHADEAIETLAALRNEQAFSAEALSALESRWRMASR